MSQRFIGSPVCISSPHHRPGSRPGWLAAAVDVVTQSKVPFGRRRFSIRSLLRMVLMAQTHARPSASNSSLYLHHINVCSSVCLSHLSSGVSSLLLALSTIDSGVYAILARLINYNRSCSGLIAHNKSISGY